MMKTVLIVVGAVVTLFVVVTGVLWISAYNQAVTKTSFLEAEKIKIYTAYSARYEKVKVYIDAIDTQNSQMIAQMQLITDARARFADAMANSDIDAANSEITNIEAVLVNLAVIMEDNPGSWNTNALMSGYMAEFSADTNRLFNTITEYNTSVSEYNRIISTFPNKIFLKSFAKNNDLFVPAFETAVPTFNN